MKTLFFAVVASCMAFAATVPASAFSGCAEYVLDARYRVVQVCTPYNVHALSRNPATRDVLFDSVFVVQAD